MEELAVAKTLQSKVEKRMRRTELVEEQSRDKAREVAYKVSTCIPLFSTLYATLSTGLVDVHVDVMMCIVSSFRPIM